MIVSQTKKTQEKLPKKRNFVTKFSKNRLKWLKFTYFVDNTSKCIPYQNFFGKLQLLLTDSQKSRIHLVYLHNFSIRSVGKKFQKIFFAWNILKHKVKPRNSRNSTFFSKLKFPPCFAKNTCKIFKPKNHDFTGKIVARIRINR